MNYYNELTSAELVVVDGMIIYIIENSIDDRVYVGATTKPLNIRWLGHKSSLRKGNALPLYQAMREYGPDKFRIRQVDAAVSLDELFEKEAELIRAFEGRKYNIAAGGPGNKGIVRSDSTRQKISNAHRGKTLSEEHRKKLSQAKLGKSRPKRSEEHSRKISEGLYRAWAKKKKQKNA